MAPDRATHDSQPIRVKPQLGVMALQIRDGRDDVIAPDCKRRPRRHVVSERNHEIVAGSQIRIERKEISTGLPGLPVNNDDGWNSGVRITRVKNFEAEFLTVDLL